MRQRFGLVDRWSVDVDQRRIHIGRVLVGVGTERCQRLELADVPQPFRHGCAVSRPPGLDRERAVQLPEEESRDRSEHKVVLPVVELDQPFEPPRDLMHLANRGDERRVQRR